jgi:hypothetical protein
MATTKGGNSSSNDRVQLGKLGVGTTSPTANIESFHSTNNGIRAERGTNINVTMEMLVPTLARIKAGSAASGLLVGNEGNGVFVNNSNNQLVLGDKDNVIGTTKLIVDQNNTRFQFLNGEIVLQIGATQTLAAGDSIDPANTNVVLVDGDGAPVTLTSTPNILSGTNGQLLIVVGENDANTVTLQDQQNLVGSNLSLTENSNFTLGRQDIMVLMYFDVFGDWLEVTRIDN